MITGIEHIGIAVQDLDQAIPLWEKLLGTPCYKTEEVAHEGVKTAFFRVGEVKIELLGATTPDSPISKFLDKRGPGIHHLALATDNIRDEAARLKDQDFEFIKPKPSPGADHKMVQFLHPKSSTGVLLEICANKEKAG